MEDSTLRELINGQKSDEQTFEFCVNSEFFDKLKNSSRLTSSLIAMNCVLLQQELSFSAFPHITTMLSNNTYETYCMHNRNNIIYICKLILKSTRSGMKTRDELSTFLKAVMNEDGFILSCSTTFRIHRPTRNSSCRFILENQYLRNRSLTTILTIYDMSVMISLLFKLKPKIAIYEI